MTGREFWQQTFITALRTGHYSFNGAIESADTALAKYKERFPNER